MKQMISNILGRLFRKEREKDIVVEKESPERNLYEELMAEKYKKMPYEYRDLRERMAEIREIICGYSKPRFLINHNTRCAYEFMNSELQLVAVTLDDIDWESLQELPEKAQERARVLSFRFPSSILRFEKGVAQVSWQLNPDARYYMDDDGYGMNDDDDGEITIYGFIDMDAKVVVKFRHIHDYSELDVMRIEAEQKVRGMNKKVTPIILSEKGLEFQKVTNSVRYYDYLKSLYIHNMCAIALDEIRVESGYVLRPEKIGGGLGWSLNLYTEREKGECEKEEFFLMRGRHLPEDCSMRRTARHPLFEHIEVPFTEMGVFQAVLLWNAVFELPMFWHAQYDQRFYLYEENLIEKILSGNINIEEKFREDYGCYENIDEIKQALYERRDELKDIAPDYLNPSVTINNDEALVRVAFWNNFEGLYVTEQPVIMVGDTVAFKKPIHKNVLKHKCSILF